MFEMQSIPMVFFIGDIRATLLPVQFKRRQADSDHHHYRLDHHAFDNTYNG